MRIVRQATHQDIFSLNDYRIVETDDGNWTYHVRRPEQMSYHTVFWLDVPGRVRNVLKRMLKEKRIDRHSLRNKIMRAF